MTEWETVTRVLNNTQLAGGLNALRRGLPGYSLSEVMAAWAYAKARVMAWSRTAEVLDDELFRRGNHPFVEDPENA